MRVRMKLDPAAPILGRFRTILAEWRLHEPRITQERMARIADVTLATAHKWCMGVSLPTLAQLEALERTRPGLVRRVFAEGE